MSAPILDFTFPRTWKAEILSARPAILPARHFVYPGDVEEVERDVSRCWCGPMSPARSSFLKPALLGFAIPSVPTGVWSVPNPLEMCAVAGGYAYIIDTAAPDGFTMLPIVPCSRCTRLRIRACCFSWDIAASWRGAHLARHGNRRSFPMKVYDHRH